MAAGRRSWVTMYVHMDEEAFNELRDLSERFPVEMYRALGGVGFFLLRRMRESIRRGGVEGAARWKRLSLMHIYERMHPLNDRTLADLADVSDAARAPRNGKRHSIPHAFLRWKKPGAMRSDLPMSGLVNALRYHVRRDGREVSVGGIDASVGRYLRLVQDGAAMPGGARGGSQRISDRMRARFWSVGVPLSGKRALDRPKRPLVEPLFNKYRRAMIDFVRARVDVLLLGPYESRDVTARRVGL